MLVWQKENITCSICGFLNILIEKHRIFLGITPFKISNDTARILQRLTNEKTYVHSKSDDNQDNNNKFMIKKQLEVFSDPQIAQKDFIDISKKLSYHPNQLSFNLSHLKMLMSLHEKEDLHIFQNINEFFKNQSILSELKKEYHLNEIASKYTLDLTIKRLFENQTNDIKLEWEEKSQNYWNLLVEINKIIFSLLEQIKDVDDFHLFNDKPFDKIFMNTEVNHDQTISEKIQLWRLLYQTISILIN